MRKLIPELSILAAMLVTLSSCVEDRPDNEETLPKVVIETDVGSIVVEVDRQKAPVTATNFLNYVDEDRYVTASFYRTVRMDNQPENEVKIQVIQGGLGFIESAQRLEPIEHETTKETGILHKNGTISMARSEPGSASSEFFICIEDQPELDFGGKRNPDGQGFAAFGRVVEGMSVVREIQQQPDSNQMLLTPIQIREIRRF